MTPFPESDALTLWLGLALFLLIEALFIIRQVRAIWGKPDTREGPKSSRKK